MSRLESSHLTLFSRSSHLTVLTKSTQNTLAKMTVMGLKYSIEFTVAFSKSRYFYSHMKCHNLLGICEKVYVKAKVRKMNLINMLLAESGLLVLHLFSQSTLS